jgi:dimethylhistidine N-methyltransferase
MNTVSNVARHHDVTEDSFRNDVIRGLSQPSKQLNCKYFYDQQGSQLFDQICELDEYYLTRTELLIMQEHAAEMAEQLGSEIALVEFGSGSSVKTRILLDHLTDPVAYLPLDISEQHLLKTALRLRAVYPDVEIIPIIADFTKGFSLPATKRPYSHAAVYFPGSTIGNFTPAQASDMMRRIGRILGPDGGLLIGIDLQKDPAVIEAAYNDSAGVTEEFNLNVLHRINRDLDADIDVEQFRHKAVYNPDRGRVEISVVCQQDETFQIDDREFAIQQGEEILTEYSHKYSIDEFARLAAKVGFSLHKSWTDDENYFAVLHLVHESGATNHG